MLKDMFAKSIVLSVTLHVAILGGERLTNFSALPKVHSLKELEVTYYQIKEQSTEAIKAASQISVRQPGSQLNAKGDFQRKAQEKDKSLLEKHVSKKIGELPKAPNHSPKEKVVPKNQFVGFRGELETDPAYITYYQAVREEIRRCALDNYTRHSEEGQVYVSFQLSSRGSLLSLEIQDSRSDASNYLKEVSRRAIKDAVPFPAFPKDLPQEEIAFNVIISFSAGQLKLSRQ